MVGVLRLLPQAERSNSVDLIAAWWDFSSARGRSEDKTLRPYRAALRAFWDDIRKEPWEVTERDLVDYLRLSGEKGPARGTLLRAIHSFYGWASPRGHVPEHPAIEIPVPKPKEKEAPSLTARELGLLCKAARERRPHDPRREPAFLFLYGTLTRIGSLCAVEPRDVHLEVEQPWVHFRVAKNDDPYSVPLDGVALDAVKELLELMEWVPKGAGGRRPTLVGVGPGQFWNWMREAGQVSGVEAWPHLLRHTALTLMSDEGGDLLVMQRLANHKDPRTTQRYVKVREPRKREHIKLLPRPVAVATKQGLGDNHRQ